MSPKGASSTIRDIRVLPSPPNDRQSVVRHSKYLARAARRGILEAMPTIASTADLDLDPSMDLDPDLYPLGNTTLTSSEDNHPQTAAATAAAASGSEGRKHSPENIRGAQGIQGTHGASPRRSLQTSDRGASASQHYGIEATICDEGDVVALESLKTEMKAQAKEVLDVRPSERV